MLIDVGDNKIGSFMRRPIKGVFSSLIADINAGLIPRRTLLKQAAHLGLTGSILGLLESCSIPAMPCSATTLTWWSEYDNIGTYKALVDAYNTIHNCEISVSYPYTKGLDTDSLHQQLAQRLQSRKYNAGDPDIISMDIIWTDEFASNGWIVPLNDFWPAKEQSLYLSLPIQSSTYQGKIYAAPFRTDVGLMYYRTDLGFPDPIPQTWTWNDLEYMVQNARSHNNSGMPQYG
jgi:multiple sugar transport system substrate-binding protein